MFKVLNSIFWLGLGVVLLITMTTMFMIGFIIPTFVTLIIHSDNMHVYHVWIAFDKLWNAILFGDHRETFSSRLGKIWWYEAPTRIPMWICYRLMRLLNVIDDNHCRKSIDWKYGYQRMIHV